MSDPELRKNILATVAYYDVMDYPLTGFEAWKYLTRIQSDLGGDKRKYSLAEVLAELQGEGLQRVIEVQQGFYFLRGRQSLVDG